MRSDLQGGLDGPVEGVFRVFERDITARLLVEIWGETLKFPQSLAVISGPRAFNSNPCGSY